MTRINALVFTVLLLVFFSIFNTVEVLQATSGLRGNQAAVTRLAHENHLLATEAQGTALRITDYLEGKVGLPGVRGANGRVGAPGPAGAPGPRGIPGPVGPLGATGMAGPSGPMGLMGVGGVNGLMGIQGIQGPSGAMGATGPPGPAGPIGPIGLTGPEPVSFTFTYLGVSFTCTDPTHSGNYTCA